MAASLAPVADLATAFAPSSVASEPAAFVDKVLCFLSRRRPFSSLKTRRGTILKTSVFVEKRKTQVYQAIRHRSYGIDSVVREALIRSKQAPCLPSRVPPGWGRVARGRRGFCRPCGRSRRAERAFWRGRAGIFPSVRALRRVGSASCSPCAAFCVPCGNWFASARILRGRRRNFGIPSAFFFAE